MRRTRVVVGATVIMGWAALAAPETLTTWRASVSSAGAGGSQQSYSGTPSWSISADARIVAFLSNADNLVRNDGNGAVDVFVHDRLTGVTTRESVGSAGAEGDGDSYDASLSADGRYLALCSYASTLASDDSNGSIDVFVRDRQAGTTTRVSVDSAGNQGNSDSYTAAISADGRYVAFTSTADNLVADDSNGIEDVFIRDLQTGTTTRISMSSGGAQGDGASDWPAISADGRYVAFHSYASTLVGGDGNGACDIFVRDRQAGTTSRVSVSSAGVEGAADSTYPSISADGRFVAFHSTASNLVSGDTNAKFDIFLRDRQTSTTTRVSVAGASTQGNSHSLYASLSGDGRYVAFQSAASNLVASDSNLGTDIFLRDCQTSTTTRVSVAEAGTQGNGGSSYPSVTSDGRAVVFTSDATNLVAGDANAVADVFVHGPTDVCLFCNRFELGTAGFWSSTTP